MTDQEAANLNEQLYPGTKTLTLANNPQPYRVGATVIFDTHHKIIDVLCLGKGSSWEEAFAHAKQNEGQGL